MQGRRKTTQVLLKSTRTRRNVHTRQMQIDSDSRTLPNPNRDIIEPDIIGFYTVSRTGTVPSFKSLRSAVLSC